MKLLSVILAAMAFFTPMAYTVSAESSAASVQAARYADGWHTDADGNYFYTKDNDRLTGWFTIGKKTYFFGEDGIMKTGWLKDGESYYYLRSDGSKAADTTLTIDGKKYSFDKKGIYIVPKSPPKTASSSASDTRTYVLNTNTKKFHLPECSSVSEMNQKNRENCVSSRDELIDMGYSPCKRCKP
ncbi:MAG: hypothetical protein IJ251_02625 [Oscillospiraceae bacterium]|nr:hypothetical protein [Oscillospiraceae bacterium]